MEIALKNFRKHKDLSIKVENGLTLLSGKNGRGKSTLLYAIYWALYGDKKNVTTHNETSTFVSIKFQDFFIKRSKPPNKLVVEKKGESYEGEIAQEMINDYMECDKNIFDVSCFIRQKHKFSSILSIGEQISVIEELSQKGNREEIKQRFKDHLKSLKQQLENYRGKILPEKERPDDVKEPKIFVQEKDLTLLEKSISELNSKISRLEKMVEEEQKKSEHNAISEQRKKELSLKISSLKSELKKYQAQESNSDIREYYSKYKKYQEIKKRREEQLKHYQEQLSLSQEKNPEKIQKEISLIEEKIRDSESFNIKVSENIKELKKLFSSFLFFIPDLKEFSPEEAIERFYKEWSSECSETECPFCERKVFYYMGELKKRNVQKKKTLPSEKYGQVIILAEKITSLLEQDNKRVDFSSLYEKKGDLLSLYKKVKSQTLMIEVLETPGVEEEELQTYLEKNKPDISLKKFENLEKETLVREEMLKKILSEIEDLVSQRRGISFYEESYEETKRELKESREKLTSDLESYKKNLTIFSQTKRFLEYQKNLDSYEKVCKNNSFYSEKIKKVEKKIGWTKTILEKIEISGVIAMSNILDLINSEAEKHLQKLFSYPVKVSLYNKKDDQVKLGIKIFVRNIPIPEIELLGGGERERIELAFCLSLNEIGGSNKILMFDESFSGVHSDAFVQSIEYLRELYGKSRPVLIISQNSIEDCYDHRLEF